LAVVFAAVVSGADRRGDQRAIIGRCADGDDHAVATVTPQR
jgi:hypothetical protein